ncbi:MAG: SpoIIE family protein phosphatase [Bacteroidetes bacterium]|nr:SpoIIE family protein phosphatase [Bacteroidota bacterium]
METEVKPFTNNRFELQKGDTVYLFTDGYADQFGGRKKKNTSIGFGKKFMYKQFKETLLSIQDKTMEEQNETLHAVFEEWKGDLPQVDDVLVIGIRI